MEALLQLVSLVFGRDGYVHVPDVDAQIGRAERCNIPVSSQEVATFN